MFTILKKQRLLKTKKNQCVLYHNLFVWLIFDFAVHLMKNNTAFTVVYTLYFLLLFIVQILCPGTILLLMSFLVKLVTGFPITVNAAILSAICLVYCIVQLSYVTSYKKMVFTKLLILAMGILTMYVVVAASVYLVQGISKGNTKLFVYRCNIGLFHSRVKC